MLTKQCIVLIGMAGAGKSTIGTRLAAVLDLRFIDLDIYIQEKEKSTIQEIIDNRGENTLLSLEEQYLFELDLNNCVIAPGGSVVYLPDLMAYLKSKALMIFLDVSFEELEKRLNDVSSRGIVGLKNKTLRRIFDERRPLYLNYADFTINVQRKSRNQVVDEIADMLTN